MNTTPDAALTSKPAWQFSMRSALLVIAVCCLLFVATHHFILPRIAEARATAQRHQCLGNLKRIATALNTYETSHGSYPPAYVTDANGKPLYSWRVLILPQLGRSDIYNSLHLNEPWNSRHNIQYAAQDIDVFYCPANLAAANRGRTNYVAVVGPETMWPRGNSLRIGELLDGMVGTLMVVEVEGANIGWMEPRDLEFSKMTMAVNVSKNNGISSPHSGCAHVVFASGVTWSFKDKTEPSIVRALLTAKGGEPIGGPEW